MTDAPKMLTAEEISDYRFWVGRHMDSGAPLISGPEGAKLLSHIAAQAARIAALEKAGDAMLREQFDGYGMLCGHCGLYTPTATQPKHTKDCPVPAWRSIRNTT